MAIAHTVSLRAHITEGRTVEVTLPPDVPLGDAEVVVVVTPAGADRRSTGAQLLDSGVFGMWAGRTDMPDSPQAARELRERAWRRPARGLRKCLNRDCALYTFNVKHYRAVAGLVALPPYDR